jgi:hypothetical protein
VNDAANLSSRAASATALLRGALTSLLDEFEPAPLPLNLVYTANRCLPIKVRAFLDVAAPRLRQIFAQ